MAKQLQLRGGTEAEHSSFTGSNKELTVDTTNKELRLHDGSTIGGIPIPNKEYVDTAKDEAIQSNYGFKNYIINGGFDVWQRGTSFTNTAIGEYTADRWRKSSLTTVNRLQIANSNVKEWGGNKYRASINASGITTATPIFQQLIENPILFSGKTVTLSFYRNVAYTGKLAVNLFIYNPTNATGYLNVDIGSVTSGGVRKDSFTYTIPELDTAVLDEDSYLAVRFIADGTTSDLSDFGITGVQLEEGSVATPFEQRPYGLELSLCQRYYQTIDGTALDGGYLYNTTGTNRRGINVTFRTKMRSTPFITEVTAPIYENCSFANQFTDDTSFQLRVGVVTTGAYRLYNYKYSFDAEL